MPARKECNTNKNKHDTKRAPIIDPTKDNPKDHLYFQGYRYRNKNGSALGNETIEALDLNDNKDYLNDRYLVGNKAYATIHGLLDSLRDYEENPISRRRNKVIKGVRDLLLEAQPDSEYSAVIATAIRKDEDFVILKRCMIAHDLWSDEYDHLEMVAYENALVK